MEQLSASVDSDDLASNAEFELLVQEAEGMEAPQPGDDKAWESVLLDLVNGDQRLSPAEINRKRKRLTFQSFRDPLMVSKVLAIESLVGPNVRQMHRLFRRSSVIASLQMLPPAATSSSYSRTKDEITSLKQESPGLGRWFIVRCHCPR